MRKKERRYTIADILSKYTMEDFLREQEDFRVEKNIEIIDENFEELAECVGREITEEEQSDILDIVDELTPKNAEGNYIAELLPFDYAWKVYEAKNDRFWQLLGSN